MHGGHSSISPIQPLVPIKPCGHVFSVSGAQATVELPTKAGLLAENNRPITVGSFLSIRRAKSLIIGLVTDISLPNKIGIPEFDEHAMTRVALLGEIKTDESGKARFRRGITQYPVLGDPVHLSLPEELQLILEIQTSKRIAIGHLLQDSSIPVFVRVDEMLRNHFAIFGTTGVGKSSGVAHILREVLDARPDLRIFLIDPHNEYGDCFENRARVINPRNLKLPFWLFSFEEMINVLFRGRSDLNDDVEILSEMIPVAKALFSQRALASRPVERRSASRSDNFTVDTPVPYRLQDLIGLIDERMGKLENLSTRMRYHRLIKRIDAVANDPRYAFIFDGSHVGGDTMVEVLAQLFRLPTEGKSVTIMQLSGFPAEIVDSIVSVVCRMAFDFGLWSDGAAPLLVVCEEAHRYAPADRIVGFEPSRKAISRIAKEGRKYGVYLGLVSQRPVEVDPTIISQCSTLFTMRLANERDQAIVGAAVSDAAASHLSLLPALGTGEVIAFGEGVTLPIRLQFKQLPEHLIPKAKSGGCEYLDGAQRLDKEFAEVVVDRWRGAMTGKKLRIGDSLDGAR